MKLKIEIGKSYKVGVDEVVGLKHAMQSALKPVQEHLKDLIYWNDCNFEDAEYKSRDGFIANRDNLGGPIVDLIVPKCEEYNFHFLEFGECDGCNRDCTECTAQMENSNGECGSEVEGHLDARLRIWLKLESVDVKTGEMEFYLNACGGNGDVPYFRLEHLSDLFEASFTAKSVAGVKRAASKHVKALLKTLGAK